MRIIKYNKLVRDKIPEIIALDNGKAVIRKLTPEEYRKALDEKLLEEVKEYLDTGEVTELADIGEVIRAILEFRGVSFPDYERMRLKKAEKRGSFKDRIFLIEVEVNN